MKKISKIALFIATIFSVVAFLILFLSAFSDRVSPDYSVYFSFLGMFFPFILIFNLLLFISWIILRKWKWALIYIIGFIFCWEAISTYFPFHPKRKDIPSECIKLLTYNVMKFDHEKPHTKEKPNPILQYMVDSNADIICMQEYSAFTNENHLNETDIKQALKAYPNYRLLQLNKSNGHVYGLAIYSRYRILSFKAIPFNSHYNGAFIAELSIGGRKVTLINNHLESNKLSMEERSEYYGLTKDFDSQKLDQITSKMNKRLTPAFKTRAQQARIVAEYIRKDKNPYMIVCGDFNDTPVSYSRHTIKGELKDAFAETGTGPGISYNRHRFLFRIDYIFHSKNIQSYSCTVDRKIKTSDHYPVLTYLQFK